MFRTLSLLFVLSASLALPALANDVTTPAADGAALPETRLPNTSVPALDLQRYAGKWYEQASLPMFFTRACVGDTTAQYTPQADGTMAVRNRCRTANGSHQQADAVARRPGQNPAELEVRFAPRWLSWLPMVWGDYWVIALDPDYQWAMVGTPGRDYLWILSRAPQLDEQTYAALVERARRMGYPVDKLHKTPQTGND